MRHVTEYSTARTKEYPSDIAQFSKQQMLLKIINTIAPIWLKNMFRYNMLLDIIICSSKAQSFPQTMLSENWLLLGTHNVQGQISELISVAAHVPVGIIVRECVIFLYWMEAIYCLYNPSTFGLGAPSQAPKKFSLALYFPLAFKPLMPLKFPELPFYVYRYLY